MKIRLLDEAECDLDEGRDFYDGIESGLGDYFAASVASDIESLKLFAGIHVQHFGFQRALSNRFPFGIYYLVEQEVISVYAVLDSAAAWVVATTDHKFRAMFLRSLCSFVASYTPTICPCSFTSTRSAAGTLGRAGMRIMVPVRATRKPAPLATSKSRTVMLNPEGRPCLV